jgi:hypothetical protein
MQSPDYPTVEVEVKVKVIQSVLVSSHHWDRQPVFFLPHGHNLQTVAGILLSGALSEKRMYL